MTKTITKLPTAALALTLMLAACTQTPSLTPIPPPKLQKTLGLYTLQVNEVTSDNPQATVQSIQQQSQEIPFNQLTFKRIAMSNLVDVTKKVVHMSATFEVTNKTGTAIQLPTFIPVDTSGSYDTAGESPFRNIKTRKGSVASHQGILLQSAYHQMGGEIQQDPNATPFLSNLDTGGLELTVPAGTTAPGISHQGWQTPALPNGATQKVTFGLQVPLKGTDISDEDPFSFSLVFAVADSPKILDLTRISEIQGNTPSADAASTHNGEVVTLEGVVTSNTLVESSLNGFYLQEEGIDQDENPSTSEGIFVHCSNNCPAVVKGDRLRITGKIKEVNSLTVIEAPETNITRVTTKIPLPEAKPLLLPLSVGSRERFESMRISMDGMVNNLDALQKEGGFDVSASRVMGFTQENTPDATQYGVYRDALASRWLRIDDGSPELYPAVLFGRNQQKLSATNPPRSGDQVSLNGILTYSDGGGGQSMYRVHTTQEDLNIKETNARPETLRPIKGNVRVGTVSAMNYFSTLSKVNSGCTTNGVNLTQSQGAENCTEFLRQQGKLVKTILELNPDVLGVLDIQNDHDQGSSSSLYRLVQALNQAAGVSTYAFINPAKQLGTQPTSLGFIYKHTTVDPVGKLGILDSTFDSKYVDTCNLPAVAQTFQSKSNGGRWTSALLNFKDRDSACPTTSDQQNNLDDGQNSGYLARQQGINVLMKWLGTQPTGVTDEDMMVMGNFNAFYKEAPLETMRNAGWLDVFPQTVYSTQRQGQWGSLHHTLVSGSLNKQVSDQEVWHVNADESSAFDYNVNFKQNPACENTCQGPDVFTENAFRGAEVDPALVGMTLDAQTPLAVDATARYYQKVELALSNVDDIAYVSVNGIQRVVAKYGTTGIKRMDITKWFWDGQNELRVQTVNTGGPSSLSYQLWADGQLIVDSKCSTCSNLSRLVSDEVVKLNVVASPKKNVLLDGPIDSYLYLNDKSTGLRLPVRMDLPLGQVKVAAGSEENQTYVEKTVEIQTGTQSVEITGLALPTRDWRILIIPIETTYHTNETPENTGKLLQAQIDEFVREMGKIRDQFIGPKTFGLLNWEITTFNTVTTTPLYTTSSNSSPDSGRFYRDSNLDYLKNQYDTLILFYSDYLQDGRTRVANPPCCGWGGGKGMSIMVSFDRWNNNYIRDGYVHEWLHTLESSNGGIGGFNGFGGLHGAEEHGYYSNNPLGWIPWYIDFIRSQVGESQSIYANKPLVRVVNPDIRIGVFDVIKGGPASIKQSLVLY